MSNLLHLDGCSLRTKNYANEFVLLRPQDPTKIDLPAFGRAIFDRPFAFIDEVIATEVEICLKLNHRFGPDSLSLLRQIRVSKTVNDAKAFQIPIWFSDRDDEWKHVCEHTKLTREVYIDQLLASQLHVAMIGFLPGFVYLKGLAEKLQIPRKKVPDKRTKSNAFAIGGMYAGIYSLPSPAGWNVVGSLGVQLLQTDQLPPLELQPGDRITLKQVDAREYKHLAQQRPSLKEYNG